MVLVRIVFVVDSLKALAGAAGAFFITIAGDVRIICLDTLRKKELFQARKSSPALVKAAHTTPGIDTIRLENGQ